MDVAVQGREVSKRLAEHYPDARVALDFTNPWQLLVATILSAQTTDVGVNKVTPVLFERYPTPDALAAADPLDVEAVVKPTGFYRNKTKAIMGAARAIVAEHGGKVPETMAGLVTLPGVARKTANIVLTNGFGHVEGIAVDTHVLRVSRRLGLTAETDPNKVERDLMAAIPEESWGRTNMSMVLFGRQVCEAKRPKCSECFLNDICPAAFKVPGWR